MITKERKLLGGYGVDELQKKKKKKRKGLTLNILLVYEEQGFRSLLVK